MSDYISDRERGPRPRVSETIDKVVWQGLYALINIRIESGSFAYGFPETCSDGNVICGACGGP